MMFSKFEMFKIWADLAVLCLLLSNSSQTARAEDSNAGLEADQMGGETLVASIPREALERLANLTQDENASNMWILVPSNLSETQLHESNFALFKLNTGQLFNLGGEGQKQQQAMDWSAQGATADQQRPRLVTAAMVREARKLGLFSNVLNKPKVSPLYLVNGTVCRFVNSQPICTTLSTTGLFRNPNPNFLMPQNANQNSGFLNLNNNNQQQQQQGQQGQQFPNSRQVGPPQNNFQQNTPNNFQQQGFQQNMMQNQQQQFRPAALMDDETQAVNLANSSATVGQQRPAQVVSRPAQPPTYTIANRRPLSLLSLTRPFRTG